LILSLPFAFAVWGVSIWMTVSTEPGSGSGAILAVTVAVGLVAVVLFVAAIKVLVRATRLTLFVLAGGELVAIVLLVIAMRSGSNLIALTVIAAVALVISVATALGTAPRGLPA
jgi:hypothetical protein